MIRIVPLKFQPAGRHYNFNATTLELKTGDKVIVETDRGRAMAIVVVAPKEIPDNEAPEGLKSILRLASEEDLALAETNSAREKDAFTHCMQRIKSRQLEMKLVRAEYAFDGSKIIFYFTADGRIDFRELVKDLAHYFHTRIEMRQIGVRDEAKLVGGLGICGRELCCCSFLTEFNPVSVKMAKEQGLALNPSKISGQCGRLLCCLSYEYETYRELKKGMPKCGKKVEWQGHECEVTNQDVLRRCVTLRERDGNCCKVTMDELESGKLAAPKDESDASKETHTSRLNKRPQGNKQNRRPSGKQQDQKKAKPSRGGGKSEQQNKPNRPNKPKPNKPKAGTGAGAAAGSKPQQSSQQPPQDRSNKPEQGEAENKPRNRRRRRNRRRPRSGGGGGNNTPTPGGGNNPTPGGGSQGDKS